MGSVDPGAEKKQKIILEDTIWQAQRRVPQEQVQPYQPTKIEIPEYKETVETKPTVIVPVPSETTRVKWEFPEEEEKPRETVPRVKAQEWVPVNEGEHVVAKTTYNPSRINRAWPPPEYAQKEEEQLGEAKRTKALDDQGWIQQGFPSDQNAGSAWNQRMTTSTIQGRVWPPPENEIERREFSITRGLNAQWPPPEFEDQEQLEVEIRQTHLPVKAHGRVWPPPQPGMDENHEPIEYQAQPFA